jgi:CheY-like chemotaxis protein
MTISPERPNRIARLGLVADVFVEPSIDSVAGPDHVLATLRHELRTPLSGLVGLVGVLLDTPLSDEQRAMVNTVLAAGEHLGALLDQTLPGLGPELVTPSAIAFDLHTMVNDIAALFRPLAEAKNVAVSATIHPGVSPIVWGDPTRLRQVLANLTSNAVKFTSTGHVEITVRPSCDESDHITFGVADSGPGFTPTNDDDLAPRADGSGIGLVISRRVVASLAGNLEIMSHRSVGTTCRFTIALPDAAVGHPRVGPSSRLLIGEDDEVSRRVLMHLAGRLGYDVHAVETGSAVLHLHESELWDVIVLDRQLPDMDGLEVARSIRAREAGGRRRTPIIASTATGTDADRERCLAAGMDHYLAKPVTLAALANRLDHCRDSALSSAG